MYCRCQLASTHRSATTLPTLSLAGASASNSLATKHTNPLFFFSYIFADLRPVRFGPDRRACDVHLRRFLLGIRRCIRFDRPAWHLLGRMAPASSARDSAFALRDGDRGAAASGPQPRLISRPSSSRSPGTRLASTTTTQLALLHGAPSTVICSRSACCLRLLHPCRRMHPPRGPSIPAPDCRAAQTASLTPAVPGPLRLPARAVPERPLPAIPAVGHPLIRVNYADAAAVVAPPVQPVTAPVCLWCPKSRARASARLASGPFPQTQSPLH